MEIHYMQKLRDNPNIGMRYNIEGLHENQIKVLEIKYNQGKKFPLAFREYLHLGGEKGGTGVVDNDFDYVFDNMRELAEYTNDKLNRPFFVFDEHSGFFKIFFLDEHKEDPDIYIYTPGGDRDIDSELVTLKRANNYTFSGLINEAIRRIKNDIPF